MALNPTKWKLNKAETEQLEEECKTFYDAQIAAGVEKKKAEKDKEEFCEKRSREMKSEKAAKSAAKKAEQKKKGGAGVRPDTEALEGGSEVPTGPDLNSDYYTVVMEAKRVILDHPTFARIEAEEPLPIKAGDSGVQAGNWFVVVQLELETYMFILYNILSSSTQK